MEEPAMPVGPVHHRSDTKSAGQTSRGFFTVFSDACMTSAFRMASAASAIMLRPGEMAKPPRRSASAVLHVVEGKVEAEIDSVTLRADESDTMAVPTRPCGARPTIRGQKRGMRACLNEMQSWARARRQLDDEAAAVEIDDRAGGEAVVHEGEDLLRDVFAHADAADRQGGRGLRQASPCGRLPA